MALENLYQCTQEEMHDLPQRLAEAFYDDDLYQVAFPQKEKRMKCLIYFFRHYLTAIAPECIFLADSKELNTVMVIYDSRKYQKRQNVKRLLNMNLKFLKFLPMLGPSAFIHLIREWDMFTSRWLNDFERGEYFHLDLIFTRPENRHQGIAEQMIRELIDEGNIMFMDITVETHHKENAIWYEKLGFVLMNTIVNEDNNLHQYCLINRYRKEQTSWTQNIE